MEKNKHKNDYKGNNRHRKQKRYNMCIIGVPEKEMEQVEEIEYTQRLRHKYIT